MTTERGSINALHPWAGYAGVCLLVTLFSIVVHPGYEVAARDQSVYLAGILKDLDPGLFTTDFLTQFNPGRYALFGKMVASTMRLSGLNLYASLLALSIAFRWLFFSTIFALALRVTRDATFAFLSCLMLLSNFLLYGTGTFTFETELLPRSAALAVGAFFLAADFYEKPILATGCLLALIALHPITAIPFLCYFYLDVLRRRDLLSWSLRLVPLLFIGLRFATSPVHGDLHWNTKIDAAWAAVIQVRSSSTWVSHWRLGSFAHLGASLLMLAIAWPVGSGECRPYWKKLMTLVAIGLGGLLFAWIGLDLFRAALFAWFQSARFLFLLKFISRLAFGFWAYRQLKGAIGPPLYRFALITMLGAFIVEERLIWIGLPIVALFWIRKESQTRPLYRFVLGASLLGTATKISHDPALLQALGIVMIGSLAYQFWGIKHLRPVHVYVGLFVTIVAGLPRFSFYPSFSARQDIVDLGRWIKNQTDKSALILTDPYSNLPVPVRLLGERSVYVSEKEGSEGIYDPVYSREWQRRMRFAASIQSKDDLFKEGVNYLLLAHARLGLGKPVFSNESYFLYQIPKTPMGAKSS